jgi:hypothetical protein
LRKERTKRSIVWTRIFRIKEFAEFQSFFNSLNSGSDEIPPAKFRDDQLRSPRRSFFFVFYKSQTTHLINLI